MTKARFFGLAIAVALAAAAPGTASAGPTIGGCPVFPSSNYWNTRVDNLPLHSSSNAWVSSVGNAANLHPDWGNILSDFYGIPYVTVTSSQPVVPITFNDGEESESDPGPYPIPPDAPIEGGPAGDGDRHVIVPEITNCILYELYLAYPISGGTSWDVYSSAKYNLLANGPLRPLEWTSADAAGLAIFPGLVRYDEAASGEINHAIRFTAATIWAIEGGLHKYLWPARHWSGTGTNPNTPPMGARFRLKAGFNISGYHALTQAILRAMKKYGIVLADGGSNWFFSGVSDTRWPDEVFVQLKTIAGSNFEVVDTAPLQIDLHSGQSVQFAGMPSNFNRDPRSDLLYRNATTGQVYRIFMNGFSTGGAALAYTEPNTAWKVVADADFNGDGVTDLLWRNSSSGQVYLMPFSASGLPDGGAMIYTEANAAWKIVHTPDLNDDGRADILWWNSATGQAFALLMNGTSIVGQGTVHSEPNTAWKIAAVGDFAGSGRRNQLLWQNGTTGQVYLMTVNYAGGGFSQTGASIYQEANTSWKIIASADFNGDGKTDIVWRNAATGQVYMMLMDGATVSSAALVYTEANLAWKIVAVGDYDGDGKGDMLYRNDATGQVFMIRMNGLAIAGQALVYDEPNTSWKILGPWEYAQ